MVRHVQEALDLAAGRMLVGAQGKVTERMSMIRLELKQSGL